MSEAAWVVLIIILVATCNTQENVEKIKKDLHEQCHANR